MPTGRQSSWFPLRLKPFPVWSGQIGQQENLLSTRLGNNPGPIALKLTERPHMPEIQARLPSSLLEQ